jgi:hypothetical protein
MPTRPTTPLDTTPLYALAGAGDLAVAKLRELPVTLQRLPRDLQANAQHGAAALAQQAADQVRLARETPGRAWQQGLHGLREQVGQLRGRAGELSERTTGTYEELATRGRQVVGQIRRQPSTHRAAEQTRSAAAKTKAAGTSTGKAAAETATGPDDAAGKLR